MVSSDVQRFTPHPCAAVFPSMDDASFDALVADIAKNGLHIPIVVDQHDRIVDGLHRYRACLQLEMTPKVDRRNFTDGQAMRFSVSGNFHRRHLAGSVRAAIAADLPLCTRGGNQAANLPDAITQAEAAEMMQTSERAVRSAAKVKKHRPDLHEQVKAGLLPLHVAERQVNEELKPRDPGKTQKPRAPGEAAIPGAYAALFTALDDLPRTLADHPLLPQHAHELVAVLTEAIAHIGRAQPAGATA